MKNTISILLLLIGLNLNAQELSLCNVSITNISVTGEVGFGTNGMDFSNTCITITGTSDICDDGGKVIGSGLTLTLESSGCHDKRVSGLGMSQDQMFIPFELLGEAPEFEGKEIPIVYPNPSKGIYTLKTKVEGLKDVIKLVSISSGKKIDVMPTKINKGYNIDLSNYPDGIYLLTYKKDGQEFSQKIIKH